METSDDKTDLRSELEALGMQIAKEVRGNGTEGGERPFSDKIDALKALTSLYATLNKKGMPPSDKDDEDGSFTFDQPFDGQEQDNDARVTPIRSRTRRRPTGA